jgi:flagellin-like protein
MEQARREQDEFAVSPVIATILLLAITVLLAGGVYMMMSGTVSAPDKGVPVANANVRALDNGYQVVTITDMSQQVETFRIKFQVVPPLSSNGTLVSGHTSDSNVYGVSGANVSFHDRDAGFTVNRGDYFVINAAAVGSDEGGWVFRMLYDGGGGRSSGEIMSVTLPATN